MGMTTQRTSPRIRFHSLLVGAVVLTALVTACSNDSSSESASTDVSSEAPEVVASVPGDIVQVASSNPGFTTLVAAVTAADLVATLQGDGPFTVFAPSDEAFAALPSGLLDKLLLEENRAVLVAILTYHVVAGKVTSQEIAAGDVATVEGSTITLGITGGVQVNDATVVLADIEASNGVIHVIDKVIIPPTVDVSKL